MDDALEQLRLKVNAETEPVLTDDELLAALAQSQIPDEDGNWPGSPGYIPTWDLDWAAAEACELRAVKRVSAGDQDVVTKIQSEGSSFDLHTERSDWLALAKYWRSRSYIGRMIGYGQSLKETTIGPGGVGYVPSSEALK